MRMVHLWMGVVLAMWAPSSPEHMIKMEDECSTYLSLQPAVYLQFQSESSSPQALLPLRLKYEEYEREVNLALSK